MVIDLKFYERIKHKYTCTIYIVVSYECVIVFSPIPTYG